MAINLELPKKFDSTVERTHLAAEHIFRPITRKYDKAEHEYPVELDELGKLAKQNRGAEKSADGKKAADDAPSVNGANLRSLIAAREMSWGDVGLFLTIPGQGLGNAAIAAVANDEQLERFGDVWAAMAITEPSFGSDSAAVSTTATADGDDYLINGEKIFVTAGSRADHVVVWATLDKSLGRAAIKSFVVPMDTEGVTVARLEHKLGIKASDTAVVRFENARVPKENLLGSSEIDTKKAFGGVMQTFDNTRPVVAAMAVGLDGPRSRSCVGSSRTPVTPSTTTSRPRHSMPRYASSSASSRIGKRRGCTPCVRRGWPTTSSRTQPRRRCRRPKPDAWSQSSPTRQWKSVAQQASRRLRCWRSGPVTPRSSTSSREPSRSSN